MAFVMSGGDVNNRTNSGVSLAFLAAAALELKDIFDYLTSVGAVMTNYEKAVLAITAEADWDRAKEVIVSLVKSDRGLIRHTGDGGLTLLHHAAINMHFKVAEFLVANGADVNALTYLRNSPLGLCGDLTDESVKDLTQLLKSNGAVCTQNERIIQLIRESQTKEVIDLISTKPMVKNVWFPPPFGPILHVAAWLGNDIKLVEFLLKKGANPNITNENGETPLHRAVERSLKRRLITLDIIRLLCRHGADPNQSNENLCTPLHQAARHSWHDPIKLLIELGAKINSTTNDGETVLDIVRSMKFLGTKSLERWLKSKGAVSELS